MSLNAQPCMQDWSYPGQLMMPSGPAAPKRKAQRQPGQQQQQQQQQKQQLQLQLQQQQQDQQEQVGKAGSARPNPRRKDGQWVNQIPELRKTKMCAFFEQGYCKHGDKCSWAHSDKELLGKPDFSKTKLCASVQRGRPCWSDSCPFAHSESELRPRADSGSSTNVPAYVDSVCSMDSFGQYSGLGPLDVDYAQFGGPTLDAGFPQLGLKPWAIGSPPGLGDVDAGDSEQDPGLPTRTPSRDNSEAASSWGADSEVLVDLLAGYFQSLLSEKPQSQG